MLVTVNILGQTWRLRSYSYLFFKISITKFLFKIVENWKYHTGIVFEAKLKITQFMWYWQRGRRIWKYFSPFPLDFFHTWHSFYPSRTGSHLLCVLLLLIWMLQSQQVFSDVQVFCISFGCIPMLGKDKSGWSGLSLS